MMLRKISVLIVLLNLFALSGISQTVTNDCVCPVIKLTEPPAPLKAGEPAVFVAEISGYKAEVTYHWTVSSGTIIEGQGTPAIKVETIGFAGEIITAMVEIQGGWCPVCENKRSGVAVIVEDVKPILIDKFTRANCEDVLSRMDNYLMQMQNNPSAAGYVITYGKSGRAAFAEREMRNWIKIRRFDPSRIVFVSGGGSGARAEIELWIVPPGANPPEPTPQAESEETEEPAKEQTGVTKPYIFGSKFSDGIEGCNTEYDVELYAETLKANPKSRGNIVIYETSQNSFRRIEKEILSEITKSGIARKRIKTFFVKVKPNRMLETIELWYLP